MVPDKNVRQFFARLRDFIIVKRSVGGGMEELLEDIRRGVRIVQLLPLKRQISLGPIDKSRPIRDFCDSNDYAGIYALFVDLDRLVEMTRPRPCLDPASSRLVRSRDRIRAMFEPDSPPPPLASPSIIVPCEPIDHGFMRRYEAWKLTDDASSSWAWEKIHTHEQNKRRCTGTAPTEATA